MSLLHPDDSPALQQLYQQQPVLLQQLESLCAINSYSLDPTGVDRCGQQLSQLISQQLWVAISQSRLPAIPATTSIISDGPVAVGRLWRLQKRPHAPLQLLCCGQLDTVTPPELASSQYHYRSPAELAAPGLHNKASLLVMLQALQTLEQSPLAEKIGWTLLLLPDGMLNHRASMAGLLAEARRCDLTLLFIPGTDDGQLISQRYGSGGFRFALQTGEQSRGDPISTLADLLQQLQRLRGDIESLQVTPAVIRGGDAPGAFPIEARLICNLAIASDEDADMLQQRLAQLQDEMQARRGYQLTITGQFDYPPPIHSSEQEQLLQALRYCRQALAQPDGLRTAASGSPACNLINAGLPVVDGLGVAGSHPCSPCEQLLLTDLMEQCRFASLWLLNLARYGLPFTHTPENRRQKTG